MAVAACGILGWTLYEGDASAPRVTLVARSNVDAPDSAASRAAAETAPPAVVVATPVSRFALQQVVVPSSGREGGGEALIGVDGLPPKAYRVGETVVGAIVLQSVRPDRALLGPAGGPAVVVLAVGSPSASSGGSSTSSEAGADQPHVRAASAPAVDRSPVPVTDPEQGVDTSNH